MDTPEDICLICDLRPSGYARVVDKDDDTVGRLCSSHTLWDILRVGLFDIRIQYSPDDEDNE